MTDAERDAEQEERRAKLAALRSDTKSKPKEVQTFYNNRSLEIPSGDGPNYVGDQSCGRII